ncbi:hypothetical protein BGX27_001547 [Mortierella sp. AM989]|nr:hypothetical protein BGX27_001547 [Mortierella sp. AM989]
MFLPWSIFALNSFFLLLELLVALSFEATLAHISRKAEGHAQSIRWIQQAGKWEMATALYLSRGVKVKTPLFALSATLFISGTLFAILTGAKSFVEEAVAEGNPSPELVSSSQVIVGKTMGALAGWTFPVPYDTGVEEALTMAINSTMGIPQLVPTKRYRPRVSAYELSCDRFDIGAPYKEFLILPNDGCATISIYPAGIPPIPDFSRMYSVQGSKGRVKLVIPSLATADSHTSMPNTVQDITVFSRVNFNDEVCHTSNLQFSVLDANHAGMTSPPRIALTKCLLKNGGSIILSTSAIRFMVPRNEMFPSVTTSIFGTQNEIVLGMQNSVNNRTLTTLPANELEKLTIMEVKATGTEVVALVCVWARQTTAEVPHIACAYTITSALITKPQSINFDISRRLVNKGLNPTGTHVTTTIDLSYFPRVSKNTVSFDIPKILNDSAAATRYFASLGNNFIVDWDGSMLYIVFDTVEILKGYEIPRWLFFSMIGVMVACFVFWVATKFLVDVRYRESLFMTVSRELDGGRDGATPRLVHFDPKTLEFEGRRRLVVSTSSPQVSKNFSMYHDQPLAGSPRFNYSNLG